MVLWFTMEMTGSKYKTFDDPAIDGEIVGKPADNDYTWGDTTEQINIYYVTSYEHCGIVEWDISSIDATSVASTTHVALRYNCHSTTTDARIRAYTAVQPTTESLLSVLWSRATSGATYYNTVGWPVAGTNKNVTLGTSGGTACSDFTTQVDNGWYAISMQKIGTDDNANKAIINSEDYLGQGPIPAPTLYVEYSVSTSVKLSQPDNVRRINRRITESVGFNDGTFKRQDIGAGGKEVIMSGHEWLSTSEASMRILDNTLEIGGKITTSDLSETYLNTDWYIVDFSWSKGAGYVNRYDWQLHLLEAD